MPAQFSALPAGGWPGAVKVVAGGQHHNQFSDAGKDHRRALACGVAVAFTAGGSDLTVVGEGNGGSFCEGRNTRQFPDQWRFVGFVAGRDVGGQAKLKGQTRGVGGAVNQAQGSLKAQDDISGGVRAEAVHQSLVRGTDEGFLPGAVELW
jgi:hypothetical protein